MKAILSSVLLLASTASAIWPLPTKYTHGNSALWIEQGKVKVNYKGPGSSQQQIQGGDADHSDSNIPKIISSAITRTYDTLFEKNFVPWKLRPRLSNFEPASGGPSITVINLEQTANHAANGIDVDESYKLEVTADGHVTIQAPGPIGLLYGLTSFTQLFYKSSSGGVYTDKAPVSITDAPKFKWRGLNLDTSRTFKTTDDIYRTLDALAYNKFNRLHWHITDAQSWPLEIPAMPELANKGVYVNDQRYSPQDVKAVYDYAAQLGITVAMEIDMPGHTSSIWFSHPNLITAFNVQPDWTTYCAEPPCGSLKLNSPEVDDFLEKLFDDVLPRIKPDAPYFHLGGDEVNKNAYNLDDTVNSNESSVLQPLMQKFMDRNMKQLKSYGLTPLVWEEMLLEWNLTLPKDTIVQTWQSDEAVAQTVAKGYQALAGNYNYWYLDCGFGQWLDFQPENAAGFWPFNDYCAPLHNWRVMYSYDPLTGVPENARHLVIGGEVHIWSEQTDSVNLDDKVWPRACAAGEVLWSGAKDASGQNRSQVEASPRLAEMRERLVARGVEAAPIQMPFCTQNGTQCAYPVA
ncbi:glycoside hydrolase family 20 protein [Dothistroma septosporum NZE10]|uniref:Beta-hexosaminidase n=1 Tax=Dothistroma septosporum (strain NZE10 / CBS 128990) TaxID=675120 RepID=N1PLS9_DOTSN|nr:glycoside hydrolase family 20 protein [Dothistroma septosporum NZE10]